MKPEEDLWADEGDMASLLQSMEEVDESEGNFLAPMEQTQPIPEERKPRRKVWMFLAGLIPIAIAIPFFTYESDKRSAGELREPMMEDVMCRDYFNKTIADLMVEIANTTNYCEPGYKKCHCKNPLEPIAGPVSGWSRAFERNKQLAEGKGGPYDVILFGDSITEHWQGTDLAIPIGVWASVNEAYKQHFSKKDGAKVEGLALGIGGDRTGELLYRVQNGEMPPTLDASVYWILLGTNDMGADHCTAEAIAAGNFLIIEEIRARRPHARIVLNSILPRTSPNKTIWEVGQQWHHWTRVNRWFECYASATDGVEFFNATDMFLDDDGKEIDEFYSDSVHPSGAGCAVWGDSIVEKLLKMI